MSRMVRLRNTKTGAEFDETERGYELRQRNEKMSEGIEFIGFIDENGNVDRSTAIDHIEKENVTFVKPNLKVEENDNTEEASTEENTNTESKENSEEGGNASAEGKKGGGFTKRWGGGK